MWSEQRERADFFIWIVSGPSGSGKTSLCDALLTDKFWAKRLLKSVSFTTRPPRAQEEPGQDYIYVSEDRFLGLQKQGAFLESEKIFGFYYGTPQKIIKDARRRGKDLLLCVDVKGAQNIVKIFAERIVSIFVLPPRFEVLGERLEKRLSEDKEDIVKRLERAKLEFCYMKDYDYLVVNDDFSEALTKIKSILTAKRCESEVVLRSIGKAY